MKIGIIGGGMLGLTLGYRLSLSGNYVDVFESENQIGGLATWEHFKTFTWDKYYHVILRQDRALLDLIDELGLNHALAFATSKTGFFWDGAFHSMSSHLEFLRFPLLNLREKMKLAYGIWKSTRIRNPKTLDGITATKWLKSTFGEKIYKIIWDPLLESKFGTLKDLVPAQIIWSTINRYYSTREKSKGKEKLGILKDHGLQIVLKTLEEKIEEKQGHTYTNARVKQIFPKEAKITVQTDAHAFSYDRVISTIPSNAFCNIAPHFADIAKKNKDVQSVGIIRVALTLKEALSPFYITNLIDRSLPMTGIIGVSNLASPDLFGGNHFVMLPRYDTKDSHWHGRDDAEITRAFIDSLRPHFPKIDSLIQDSFVAKDSFVQGIWNFPIERYPKVPKTKDSKVWNVNNELAGWCTLNNNAIVELANRVAKEI